MLLSLTNLCVCVNAAYTMAKYGMSMCTLGMAEELRSSGIAVNSLWPRTGAVRVNNWHLFELSVEYCLFLLFLVIIVIAELCGSLYKTVKLNREAVRCGLCSRRCKLPHVVPLQLAQAP